MKNYKVWISIASATGLSVVSLGTPGLKEDLDEQVFTGGISAVTHLLTTEIGSSERSFIGGGDTRKMGRFVISKPRSKEKTREVITQFLLMTNDDSKVLDTHLTYIKEVAINFATLMIKSPIWDEVEKGFKTLSAIDVLDTFIDSVLVTRKKLNFKIQPDDHLFTKQVKNYIDYSFKHGAAEYFETLQKIAMMEPTKDSLGELKEKNFLHELAEEILSIILDNDPIPVLFKSKPRETLNEIKDLYDAYIRENLESITKIELIGIMNDLFSGEIADIMKNFNVIEMRESRLKIHAALANEVIVRVSKNNPLLLVVNPTFKSSSLAPSFNDFIDENVEAIYQEYDLASILGKIASFLLEGEDPVSIFLISEFIRMFAMHFPAGLSNHGWKFIHTTFKMFSKMKGTKIKDALEKLEISESHLATINSFLKAIKPASNLKTLRFTVTKEGEELVKFYSILQQVIVEGAQNFFNEIIWTPKQLGIFSQRYTESIETVVQVTQHLTSIIAVIKYISTTKSLDYISPYCYIPSIEDLIVQLPPHLSDNINFEDLSDKQRIMLWQPEYIVICYEAHSLKAYEQDITAFQQFSNKIQHHLEKNIKNISTAKDGKAKYETLNKKRISFEHFNILDSFTKDIVKHYSDIGVIYNKLNGVKGKQKSKTLEDMKKSSQKLIKRINDYNKRVRDHHEKFKKNIVKESQKLQKEAQKIFFNALISEFQIKIKSHQFEIPKPAEVGRVMNNIIENFPKDNFPKNNELISTFASIVIFNHLPRNIFNDVLNTAILSGGKGSPIINEMISEMRLKRSPSVEYLFIEDHLKKSLRKHTEERIVIILESIINQVNKSYFKGLVRSYIVNSDEYEEISCMDIGELNIPWLVDVINNNDDKNNSIFGKKVHFIELDGKFHVLYEIERFPSSGQRFPITKAIMQGTWNEIIADQAGLYIEILKMSCELLGEGRRKRFQVFLEKLFQIID